MFKIYSVLLFQMKKIAESSKTLGSPTFEATWHYILADYMMLQHQPQFVRRQVRKVGRRLLELSFR